MRFGPHALLATALLAQLPAQPSHWSARYVGRRYGVGGFDCGELARTVQREVFGREINLPAARDYEHAGGPLEKLRLMAAQIERCKDDVARRVEQPQEGDGVLLITRGYHQHIGVHCHIAGERWALHASDGFDQVVLQRESALPLRGVRIEGYYRWI